MHTHYKSYQKKWPYKSSGQFLDDRLFRISRLALKQIWHISLVASWPFFTLDMLYQNSRGYPSIKKEHLRWYVIILAWPLPLNYIKVLICLHFDEKRKVIQNWKTAWLKEKKGGEQRVCTDTSNVFWIFIPKGRYDLRIFFELDCMVVVLFLPPPLI